ncbi:distal membrane-arm assembly complex protein 1 [Protobothrops mucrosquamatus]|uniref:distal membrane-arm assembly complex protein 1 n=1 Tax=Protobothrops mucrosquamatus TaxID=103944 RepID=UPI0007759298|nr:distal membrane-arm assembly complex protein 1 [Protobothrops mucrosquamatus]
MAAQPGGGVVAGSSPAASKKSAFWSCFSCRMLTGGGLLASGVWVYMGVRRSLRQRRPGTVFDVFRLAFAIGLSTWAVIVILDPIQPK